MLFNTVFPVLLSLAVAAPSFAAPVPHSTLDRSSALSLRNAEWNELGGRAAIPLGAETSALFHREDPELVAGILRRVAAQELERRGAKDLIKKVIPGRERPPPLPPRPPPPKTAWQTMKEAVGMKAPAPPPPPPKKNAWQKMKAAVGKKPPPPPPKKTAWDHMKAAVGMQPSPPPKKTAWQKVKSAVGKKPPPPPPKKSVWGMMTSAVGVNPPAPPPKKSAWQKVKAAVPRRKKARSDPELEDILRRTMELELARRGVDIAALDELELRDVGLEDLELRDIDFEDLELRDVDLEDMERRDIDGEFAPLFLRDAELDELD